MNYARFNSTMMAFQAKYIVTALLFNLFGYFFWQLIASIVITAPAISSLESNFGMAGFHSIYH